MYMRDLKGIKKAVIPFHDVENLHGAKYRKEKGFFRQESLVVMHNREPVNLAAVRWYSTGATVYCCVWIHAKGPNIPGDGFVNVYLSGSGKADGYGYCKQSAAMAEALESAGINLPFSLHGTGMFNEALDEIAAGCGFKKCWIVSAHA